MIRLFLSQRTFDSPILFTQPAGTTKLPEPTPQGRRPPGPPPAQGGDGGVLAYGLRWGTPDSERAELGLVCGGTGWMGLVLRHGVDEVSRGLGGVGGS